MLEFVAAARHAERRRGSLAALTLACSCFVLMTATGNAEAFVDYDCSDFSTQAEAHQYLLPGDPHRLDADGDGIPCETLPAGIPPSDGGGGSSEPTPAPPPPPKPPKLQMGAAKGASINVVRRFVRRNRGVSKLGLLRCGRSSRHRIDCTFKATGRTAIKATACRLKVVARGEGRQARTKLRRPKCSSRMTLHLSAGKAKRAIRAEAADLYGPDAKVYELGRKGGLAYSGSVEWAPDPEDPGTTCRTVLTAKLVKPGQLRFSTSAERCQAEVAL